MNSKEYEMNNLKVAMLFQVIMTYLNGLGPEDSEWEEG